MMRAGTHRGHQASFTGLKTTSERPPMMQTFGGSNEVSSFTGS